MAYAPSDRDFQPHLDALREVGGTVTPDGGTWIWAFSGRSEGGHATPGRAAHAACQACKISPWG